MQRFVKRGIDIAVSLGFLVILTPLMFLIGLAICLKLGWPIFFIQERPGKVGNSFKMIKFRSMLGTRDRKGRVLTYEERMTPFGKVLRGTSMDELPELINVLKGEMSLVGPRPLLTEYLLLYNDRQSKRHWVRPGITGWAQVNGRNAISWDEKFEHDIWYVENWSLGLDFKILFMTVGKVLKREGINQKENLNMEMWTGNVQNL